MLTFTVLNYINVISLVFRWIRSYLQMYYMTDRTFETLLKAKSLYVQWEGYVSSICAATPALPCAMHNTFLIHHHWHPDVTLMENLWNDPDGKTEVFGEKLTPVLLRPLQIPHRLVGFDSRLVILVCGGHS